ncbi:uncharacterized protein LOC143915499 [Arctopsyche grandis]|uniref:uncharacterized protein LOC143914160 n=1 Tax=Arctopsyche grandis TaxID=121162 RepID=UPI00406D8C67
MFISIKLSLLLKLYNTIYSAKCCVSPSLSITTERRTTERISLTKISDQAIFRMMKDVTCFECNFPQERSFKSEELLNGSLSTSELVYPAWTSLHVCDNSTGYCPSGICGVNNSTKVQLHFQVIDNFSKIVKYVKYDAVNHTRCGCS